jgi:hypothetical protein
MLAQQYFLRRKGNKKSEKSKKIGRMRKMGKMEKWGSMSFYEFLWATMRCILPHSTI